MTDVKDFLLKITGQSEDDWDRNVRVTRLATYNAERGRGIVHTAEWQEFMVEEQAWFDGEHNTGTRSDET